MKYARIAPILLSGVTLGIASYSAPRVPNAPRDDIVANADTLDTAGGISPISVTALAPGDELRMSVDSHGCFHHFRYTLTLRPDESGATLQLDSDEANLAPGYRLTLRQTHLDKSNLIRLERLLMFYRSNTRSGCTTVDSIAITSMERGVVRHESYVDASCATYDDDTLSSISGLLTVVSDSVIGHPPN